MQPTHRTVVEKRLVTGITGASLLAALACTIGVLEERNSSRATQPEQQPFWATNATTSNLAVVELYRSHQTASGPGSH